MSKVKIIVVNHMRYKMTILEIINNVLYEEQLPRDKKTGRRKRGILLLDIDDTLLKATNIYIWRKLPSDKEEVRLTPDQYAKEKVPPEEKKYYDYREFRDPIKVRNSILKGIPYVNNLKIMDKFINGGYKVGVLTARGLEDVVYESLSDFLKYRGPDGKLRPVVFNRKYFFAVNDDDKVYVGETDYIKKRNVINKIRRYFDYVYFLDDDIKNIKEVLKLKEELPEKQARKLRTIVAHKPKEEINESLLNEMAVSDLTDKNFKELINGVTKKIEEKDSEGNVISTKEVVVKEPDLEKAGLYYINSVLRTTRKDKKTGTNRFSGKTWIQNAHAISGQGLSRTLNTALKKGLITQEFADKVRKAVDLAVKNPPKDVLEKEKEIEIKDQEKAKEREQYKTIGKFKEELLGDDTTTISKFVVRTRREIDRVKKFSNRFIKVFLESDMTNISDDNLSEYTKNLKWIEEKFIPSFVEKPSINKARRTKIEEADGVKIIEDSWKALWRLEEYGKELEKVNDTLIWINRHSGLKTKEEKIEELGKNVGMEQLFKQINPHFENMEPADRDRDLNFYVDREEKSRSKRENISNDAKKLVSKYYKELDELGNAYENGEIKKYLYKKYKGLRRDILFYSYAVRNKEAKGYKEPEGFDDKEIEEAVESSNQLLSGREFHPEIEKIINERETKGYTYSGTKRDMPELRYLENFVNKGKGSEEKAFRILVNIYLDFIDGMGLLYSAKDSGVLGTSKSRVGKIDRAKAIKNREAALKKMDIKNFGAKEVKDLFIIRAHKMNKELRSKINVVLARINFDNFDRNQLDNLISFAKDFRLSDEDFYKQLVNREEFQKDIDLKTAKKMIDKEIAKFTPEEKFSNRVAISVNYNGNKFTDSQLVALAKTILQDPSGAEFKDKLKDKEYSERIQG